MHRAYIKGWRSRLPEKDTVEYLFTETPRFAERWYTRVAAEMFILQLSAGIKIPAGGGEITCQNVGLEEVSPGTFIIYCNFPPISSQ